MARKRFIKPEFFRDLDMAEISIESRYLYAGLWPWMDKQGVIEADPRVHRANVFPHDEKVTVQKVNGWLNELLANGFVVKFSWQGKDLLFCPKFSTHQRLFPDEQAKYNVSESLLSQLSSNAPLPAQSLHSTVQEPDKEKDKDKERVEEKEAAKFDFEVLYKAWPRKRGKDEGMNRLRSRIVSQVVYEQFAKAVRHFIAETEELKTEKKYIPYWSSFVGTDRSEPWRDYIDWVSSSSSEETKEQRVERMIREREGRAS